MTFGGCRQAAGRHGALPSRAAGEKEKRRRRRRREKDQKAARGGRENSAHQVVLLASARRAASGIQVLVLATRTHPGCSSARLWLQGQEFPTLLSGREHGRHISVI